MSRHVNVCVPHDFADHISHLLYTFPHAFKIVRFNTFTSVHISFKVQPKHLQEVVLRLGAAGCGESYGTIDVFSCLLTRPLLDVKLAGDENKTPKYSVSDRLTVDEIEDIVEDGNHLTFDYMAQIAVASVIAGVGLITDSATVVIAAMLVSPLMGPILSLTFGITVLKRKIVSRGMRNEVIGVVIGYIVGVICGLVLYPISGTDFDPGNEILARGRVEGLIAGSVVAAASGMGVILALSKGGVNAIVGTSISASLLPPCVNSGICTSYKQTAVVSLLLYFMNFVLIVVVGVLTLRYIKKIYPYNDPRNLPNNPHLNIPRSLLSEEGASVTSANSTSSSGKYPISPRFRRHVKPDMMSTERMLSQSPTFTPFDTNTMTNPLLSSKSVSHDGPRDSHDHYCVEDTIDSPQAVNLRKEFQSVQDNDLTDL